MKIIWNVLEKIWHRLTKIKVVFPKSVSKTLSGRYYKNYFLNIASPSTCILSQTKKHGYLIAKVALNNISTLRKCPAIYNFFYAETLIVGNFLSMCHNYQKSLMRARNITRLGIFPFFF